MEKVLIVIPAYNAERTLSKTIDLIPKDYKNIVVIDDGSRDNTAKIAEALGLKVVSHKKNQGYGAAQKTGYRYVLNQNADVVVLVHADGQYDPRLVPKMIEPIVKGKADAVLGSRILGKKALAGGMPVWKYFFNRLLTKVENIVLGTSIAEFHTGFRAYSRKFLAKVPFEYNSNLYDFDTEILIQAHIYNFRVKEIPIPTIYESDSSQMSFIRGVGYGLAILRTLVCFHLSKIGILKDKRFGK